MSRIQDILDKAERDGTARRTRALSEETMASAPAAVAPAPPRPERGASVDVQEFASRSWTPPPADLAQAATVQSTLEPHLVAAIQPTSLAAEQYRSLRTRIKRAENGRAVRSIVVTSPGKGDGKSLTAANLALTMAQEFQQRVLLIDADLRRPVVHQLFGVADAPGLSDVLVGAADLEQALVHLSEHHLALLPAGTPPSHPAELLGSATMRRVLDTLRTRFDRILIDMPPVAPLADLHIVAPIADAVLMIVRAGITPKPAIERALAGLDVSKVLGLVLNESGTGRADKYAYEDYGYIAG